MPPVRAAFFRTYPSKHICAVESRRFKGTLFLRRLVFREIDTIADEAPQFQLEMFSSLILYKTDGTPLGKQKIPGPTQQCRPRKKSYFVCRDCNSIVHFIYSILLDADRMTNSVQPSFSMIIGWRSKTKENRQAPSRLYAQSQDSHSSKSPGGMVLAVDGWL